MKDWLWNLWFRLKDIYYLFLNIPHWIVKVCRYSRLLWADRDWNENSLLLLLAFKLARMRRQMTECKYHYHKKQIRRCQIAEKYLLRAAEEKYLEHEDNWLDETYGELEVDFVKEKDSKYSTIEFSRSKCKSDKDMEFSRWYSAKIHDKSHRMKQWELSEAFRLIGKYLPWWGC